jgi:NAD(P)-dependent dehydrogenase (short-subunit alcohol dehydrogenase family)
MTRTIVITGASSGVGLAAAEQLAARGDQVVVVGRDQQRLTAAVEKVTAAGQGRVPGQFRADFERLDDVRALAEHLLSTYPTIDVLANNAGAMIKGYRRTPDGFEATIQANHLGPFLLSELLRERLAGGRIVNTASQAHRGGRLDPGDLTGSEQTYKGFPAYGGSKAANILFTAEAARRWPEITSVSFHPGVVRSNFGDGATVRFFYRYSPFLTTSEKAGELLTWLCTAPGSELTDGGYYVGHKVAKPARNATDPAQASRLWQASAKAVGLPG